MIENVKINWLCNINRNFDLLIDFSHLLIDSLDLLIDPLDLLIDSLDLLIDSLDLLIDFDQSFDRNYIKIDRL